MESICSHWVTPPSPTRAVNRFEHGVKTMVLECREYIVEGRARLRAERRHCEKREREREHDFENRHGQSAWNEILEYVCM